MAILSPRLTIVKNICRSIFNLHKKSSLRADSLPPKISKTQQISFSKKLLCRYKELINWDQEGIPPLFPYALCTHIHFSVVNNKYFPFSPYGLLHKKEQIWCKRALTYNALWDITSFIETYRILENGIEFDLVTELRMNEELVWKSVTTAFKKIKQSKRIPKSAENIDATKGILINVPGHYGRQYAMISNNVDPIHISSFLAKMQGHKSAIMHGMWAMSRALSEVKGLAYPLQLTASFKASIPIPSSILFVKKEENKIQCIDVYSHDATIPYVKIEVQTVSILF